MPQVETRAILLRSYPYSETSRVLRFLTRDAGIAGVLALGVRRRASKGGVPLRTFAEGTLLFHSRTGRELHRLVDFQIANARPELSSDLRRVAGASLLVEMILGHGAEGEDAPLFDALSGALDGIASAAAPGLGSRVLAEGWKLVALLGFWPELRACARCGRALGEQEVGRFDIGEGGAVCERRGVACNRPDHPSGRIVGPVARGHIENFLKGRAPKLEAGERAHLKLLGDYAAYHLTGGKPLASLRYLIQPAAV